MKAENNALLSSNITVFLVISTTSLIVYGEVINFEFAKDDFFSVLPIPNIDKLSSIFLFFTAPVQTYFYENDTFQNLNYYRPIATSTLTFDFFLFGKEHPGIFHAENLFIHIINSFLLFHIFTFLIEKRIALLGAVAYSVFPLSVEIISIYHYRVDLVVTFFIFSTLLVTVKVKENKWKYYASGFFFLSMLSKEIGIILIVFVPILRFYCFNKFSFKDWCEIFLIPLSIYWLLRYNALGGFILPDSSYLNLDSFKLHNIGLSQKLHIIFDAFAIRFYWIFSPFEIPPVVLIGMSGYAYFFYGVLLLFFFIFLSFLFFFKKNLFSLSAIFIVTTWFPLSSILLPVPDPVSSRLFYYFSPWIILFLFAFFSKTSWKLFSYSLMLFCIVLWGSSSFIQKKWYKNNLTINLGVLNFYPDHPVYHLLTGIEYWKRNKIKESSEYFNKGLLLFSQNKNGLEKALKEYNNLIFQSLFLLSKIYIKTKQFQKGEKKVEEGLKFFPEKCHFYFLKAQLLLNRGKKDEAKIFLIKGREKGDECIKKFH